MAQKDKAPTKEQQKILQGHALDRYLWVVVKDLNHSMIVKHRITGEFKVIDK